MDTDAPTASGDADPTSVLPEVEIFCYLVVIMFLVDKEMYAEVCAAPPLATPSLVRPLSRPDPGNPLRPRAVISPTPLSRASAPSTAAPWTCLRRVCTTTTPGATRAWGSWRPSAGAHPKTR